MTAPFTSKYSVRAAISWLIRQLRGLVDTSLYITQSQGFYPLGTVLKAIMKEHS